MTRAKFIFDRKTGFNQIRIGEQDESVVEFNVDTISLNSGSTFELNGANIPYTPEDPSQWSNVPTNLVQAVDYLAAGSGSGGGGGGGGTPGGSNGDIQYRVNATTFGGVNKLKFIGGNVFVTGSFLGDVVGTASYATNAGSALTASYVLNAVSSSFATNALTASFVQNAVSSSFASTALSASYAGNADLLDNLDSTAFARLTVGNIFTANQVVSGTVTSTLGFSGSLTKLADGTSYLVAGTNVTLTTGSNGSVTIDGVGSIGGTIASNEVAFGTGGDAIGGSPSFTWNPGTYELTVADPATIETLTLKVSDPGSGVSASINTTKVLDLQIPELQLNSNPGSTGQVLTSQGAGSAPIWSTPVASAVSGSSINVVYVAKNGSDSSVSGSINSPFLTIQGAINYIESKRPSIFANDQDVVIAVAPGVYSEDVTFTKPFINLMGYVPTQYSKATQLRGLVNVNNTTNPGGGTGQIFGLYNFLITPPTTASANVVSFSGTGNGSLILENMQIVGGGSNQSILYVSKSAAVATNCRVKARHSIFNTETAGSAGPTANIFNVYSVFESCEIGYSGSVSGGTVLNTNNAIVEFYRGTLTAATANSIVAKITGSAAATVTVGDTAVVGTSAGTNGFLLAPGAYLIGGKNAYTIATGTTFVVSGSATSNFITAFDGIIAGGILYNNRISNSMTTTFASASFTKVT